MNSCIIFVQGSRAPAPLPAARKFIMIDTRSPMDLALVTRVAANVAMLRDSLLFTYLSTYPFVEIVSDP